ncbi:sensor histidine kinase [Dyadobacter psychrotolerans]|uniref:histidine kinase n=1 Tax=Dyadobacter psychrotolerans TaxID=2541721 RepID=A0A4R5DKJ9_9BACT|nr:ATP-binding protein [Dyadobacter psychrotolerans]TDE14706.1 PAS domain S-box protein [Dyadobacter psychrotolerans]
MEDFRIAHDILQAMPCGCVSFDENGIIEFVNQSMCDLLGYETADLIDQNIERIFTISSRIFYQTQLYALIRLNGKADEIFISLKAKQGEVIPVVVYGKLSKTLDKTSIICSFLTVWEQQKHHHSANTDDTDRPYSDKNALTKLKEEFELYQQKLDRQVLMLLQRNQEYVQLSKVLSHDLSEPIRKIGIFTDLLMNHSVQIPDPVAAGRMGKIQKSVQRLQNLTNSLQQFIYVDNIVEETTVLDFSKLVAESKNEIIIETGFSDFQIISDHIPGFQGRSAQIGVLLKELLQNAIQNRLEEQPLMIKITSQITEQNSYQVNKTKYNYTDHIKLEITDNGSGFENEYASHVFGLFNKLNNKSAGAGLGLALCKQIVSYHYGTITASSKPNHGTTVTIMLPIWQPV